MRGLDDQLSHDQNASFRAKLRRRALATAGTPSKSRNRRAVQDLARGQPRNRLSHNRTTGTVPTALGDAVPDNEGVLLQRRTPQTNSLLIVLR